MEEPQNQEAENQEPECQEAVGDWVKLNLSPKLRKTRKFIKFWGNFKFRKKVVKSEKIMTKETNSQSFLFFFGEKRKKLKFEKKTLCSSVNGVKC